MDAQISPDSPTKSLPWYKEINREQWHVLTGSTLGWGLDAFDNALFTYSMYSIIKEFHITTAETGLVATVTLLASAFGGAVFGVISDKIGRLRVLTLTILLYSLATGLIGFTQNIWQLMLIRVIVGIGLGGEWSAGATLISETWPEKHRGKGLAIMQSGMAVGMIMATLLCGPIIAAWGWRTLFFIGVIPGLLVLYVRKSVKESPLWLESRNKAKTQTAESKKERVRFSSLFKKEYLGMTLLGLFFVGATMTASWPIGSFMSAYLATPVSNGGAGVSTALSSQLLFPFALGGMIGYLAFGFLSDKLGRKKVFIVFLIMALIFGPLEVLTVKYSFYLYVVCALIYGFFGTGLFAGMGSLLSELYPTSIRGSGVGLVYNGGRFFGSLSMFVSGVLIAQKGYVPVLLGTLAFFGVAAIFCFFIKERTGVKFEA